MASQILVLDDETVEALAKQFQAAAAEGPAMEAADLADAKGRFCESWEQARQALELLRTVIVAVPGFGIVTSGIIGVAITAGDAAHRAFCRG